MRISRHNIKLLIVVALVYLLSGCSTTQHLKKAESQTTSPQNSVIHSNLTADTLSRDEMKSAVFTPDTTTMYDSNSEAAVTQLLERARQHYVQALQLQQSGDTLKSQDEFEYSIAILNEIAYFPGVDSNTEFSELTKSVVDDYEKYISNVDILSPHSSIFALQEKLNQLAEQHETPEEDIQTGVVHTTTIPLIINGHVQDYLDFFQTKARKFYERWLFRSGKYFPMMKRVFKEEGVPEELVYLSMVESGLNPTARSWAKAVGIWQFVKGTGKLYGLNGNSWYDERRDFDKATHAAAKHFKDLYKDFNDWYLVLAAYNSGAGRVSRAIKKSHSTDFWEMRPFLPKETRNYVPQYIAAALIALDPKCYGFDIPPADTMGYDVVKITGSIDLSVLAQCAKTDATDMQELNPELIKWCTPPGLNEFTLRIPPGMTEEFMKNYQAIPEEDKRPWHVHKVKKGETLARIAKMYGLTSKSIADLNKIPIKKRLSTGQELIVPVPAKKSLASAAVTWEDENQTTPHKKTKLTVHGKQNGKAKVSYKIKKGDTLAQIAHLFRVRTSDLRVWNDLAYGNNLHVDETLDVWVPMDKVKSFSKFDVSPKEDKKATVATTQTKTKTESGKIIYQVKNGDNLASIAKLYGVSVQDVRKWNKLHSNTIKVGAKLEIHPTENTGITASKKVVSKSNDNSAKKKTYVVKKGDTIYSIAVLFGVSVNDLLQWNNLKDVQIFIGQELNINS